MLNFVRKVFSSGFGILLWIVLIVCAIVGAIGGGSAGGGAAGVLVGLIGGIFIGLLVIIGYGGLIAIFIEMDKNIANIAKKVDNIETEAINSAKVIALLEKIADGKSGS
ncbi:MAG: hypothetical protein LBC59_00685 [Chitinispirillales bacterium]|jgi:hypothetical protein|nr:hypothetical protein [Chitinispirillales bacterium]